MFVSREEALTAHEQRHKLRCCRNGECWLFVPYMPSVCYSLGHYGDDGWTQCPGDGCVWHHRKIIPKAHVVALCIRVPLPYSQFRTYQCAKVASFRPAEWDQKIMELTGGIIKPFTDGQRPADTMCLVARAPGRKTMPLELRWLDSCLTGVPSDICQMHIPEMLPGIIKNDVVMQADRTPLDNSAGDAIKHKTPYRTR